jgi:hypothetical protein
LNTNAVGEPRALPWAERCHPFGVKNGLSARYEFQRHRTAWAARLESVDFPAFGIREIFGD